MTKETFTQIIRRLNNISEDCPEITDEMAFDIAQSTLQFEPGLEDYIKNNLKVSDIVGWLMQEVN